MRTTITADQDNRCTLRYEDEMGDPVTREFFAPSGGGYVREDWTNARQVCVRLSSFGDTLIWRPVTGTLADLIRRERRAALSAERRRRRGSMTSGD